MTTNADGISRLDAAIARFDRKCEEVREYERELHETMQEAKRLLRELRETNAAFERDLNEMVEREIQPMLKEVMDPHFAELRMDMRKAAQDARRHIDREIKQWANICLYGNKQGRGENLFQELRQAARAQRFKLGGPL